jgi:hypothetical protein
MKNSNTILLWILAPIILIAGIGGFFIPYSKAIFSGAPAYNIFHIIAAIIAFACLFSKSVAAVRAFNLIFGLIDLYQAAAGFLLFFPIKQFLYRPADNYIHVVLGLVLVGFAIFAKDKTKLTPVKMSADEV